MADTNALGTGGDDSSVPLSRIPLFHGLSDEQRSALASKLQRRTVAAGTVILREGEPGEHLFVIVSGGVRVASDDLPDAVFLGRLGPGEFFGETALLRSRVRTAAVIAESDTELLVLSRGDFDELSQAHPDLRYEAERVLRLREAEDGASGQAHDAPSLLALPRAGDATWTATSVARREPRASNRLATLAQAMSSTASTAPNSTSRVGRIWPRMTSVIGSTNTPRAAFSGYMSSSRVARPVISSCACATVTPGFRRAICPTLWRERGLEVGPSCNGTHRSVAGIESEASRPTTPMMVWAWSFRVILVPRMSGLVANNLVHKPSLIIATS